MELTTEQRRAMEHFEGPALIIAVPGAGKTTVLLERIRYLTEVKNVKPKRILSITFSKQQAVDMERRFTEKDTNFSTIHAFCYSIIRYHQKLNKTRLQLIESKGFSKYTVIQRLYLSLFKKYISDDELEKFFRHYGYLKNTMISPIQVDEPMPGFRKLYKAYEAFKKEHHYFDFEDMLRMAYDLLDDEAFLKKIRRSYDFIQVDEGQDTSKIQVEIIKKIAAPKNNLFIVADDDQSIYSFRGADPGYLLDFKSHYPDASIYFIEENHRSSEDIVKASNKIIAANKKRYRKNIYTNKKETAPLSFYKVKDLEEEYDVVEKLIREKKKGSLGILYRNNISALGLCRRLLSRNIDFFIPRFKLDYLKFFVMEDLKDIIYFVEHPADLQVFSRIYYKLNAYIKKTMINMLTTYDEKMPIFDRLLDNPALSDFYVDKFLFLKDIFAEMRKQDIPTRINRILEEVGYKEFIDERVNLESKSVSYDFLVDMYKEIFDGCDDYDDMIRRIEDLAAGMKRKSRRPKDVVLSTVHGAKGLEYDEVILLDLVDGEFPILAREEDDEERFYEEERRLFYVAMTRARNKLHLIVPKKRNGFKVKSSRYVRELQED